MFLLNIQAELVTTGNSSHNPYPIYFMGCFSHTSSSHRDLPQQTYAQYILYGMFLLHIQTEIMPTRISSHKPVPSTFSKGCFSCMFRLKWCLCETPTNSCPLCSLFFLHSQAEIMPTRISFHKPVPSTFSKGCFSGMFRLKWCLRETPTKSCPLCSVFLTQPGWNHADRKLLLQTHAHYALPDVSLTHPG